MLEEMFRNPDDDDAVRVWADVLVEQGDPRGEFLRLSLLPARTAEQEKARAALAKKLGGKLVGPARPFLRVWAFGPNGLVDRARCEADKLVEGFEEISRLHPRLSLGLTSTKTKSTMRRLAELPLGRIHHLDFTGRVLGGQPSQISDDTFRTLIPALRQVKNLGLSCVGDAERCFSPAALRQLGDECEGIEYLLFEHAEQPSARRPLAPLGEYADAILGAPGFKTLKVLFFPLADRAALWRQLPNLTFVETHDMTAPARSPENGVELARLKAMRPAPGP